MSPSTRRPGSSLIAGLRREPHGRGLRRKRPSADDRSRHAPAPRAPAIGRRTPAPTRPEISGAPALVVALETQDESDGPRRRSSTRPAC